MRYLSPLRYPGGKARLAPYLASLLRQQRPRPTAYAEPFAGGAGAALRLLVDEHVDTIHLNDLNPGIAAFWRAVTNCPAEFEALILSSPITLDAWHEAVATYAAPADHDDLQLGFATFLLNRCNRSGILDARPIGGLGQTGNWKIDARFNRETLAERVRVIGRYAARIRVTQLDARDFIGALEQRDDAPRMFMYVDPPYLGQGEHLYMDSLSLVDHRELADRLRATLLKWFLTYDADPRITNELYARFRCKEFDIAHTAQRQHVGTEYAVYSDTSAVSGERLMRLGTSRWVHDDAELIDSTLSDIAPQGR